MLNLSIYREEAPPQSGQEATRIQVWRDNAGADCAYGYRCGEQYTVEFPNRVLYSFDRTSDTVVARVAPSTAAGHVTELFNRSVLPIALQVRGHEALHASAVHIERGVLALCAVSETGKSTLAYGLSRRGYPLCADDAVVLAHHQPYITVLPVPFAVRLRPASARHFAGGAPLVSASPAYHAQLVPTQLAAICVLVRSEADPPGPIVAVRQVTGTAAFSAVLTHAYYFNLQDMDHKRRLIQHYLRVVTCVPVFEVRFHSGLVHLPIILDRIEQLIADLPAAEVSRPPGGSADGF